MRRCPAGHVGHIAHRERPSNSTPISGPSSTSSWACLRRFPFRGGGIKLTPVYPRSNSSVNKPATGDKAHAHAVAQVTNFIRNIIEADLAQGTNASRTWGGKPGPASA